MQEKIKFITKRTDHLIESDRIEVINDIQPVINWLNQTTESGLDTENNSLNPFLAIHLLLQLGDKQNTFVIDRTSIDNNFLTDYTHLNYLGTNLQYDSSILDHNERHLFPENKSIKLPLLKDLMVAEQILTRGSGLLNSLEAIHLRRLNTNISSDKSIRTDFISMNKNSVFETRHILYAATDIICLKDIERETNRMIEENNLHRRVFDIGYPLVHILEEMHINGSCLDTKEWEKILNENKALKLQYEVAMDKELIKLGYRTKVRRSQELVVVDLFGNDSTITNQNIKNINYSSQKQVLEIFRYFNLPKPQGKDKKTHLMKESTGDEAINQYLIAYPDTPLKTFLTTLLDYKGVEKRINSFGLAFVREFYPDPKNPAGKNNLLRGFYNSYTGKVHTKYKQEFTANGRLSSGSDR